MSEDKIEITIKLPVNLFRFYEAFNNWAKVYCDGKTFIENMAIDYLTDHAEELVCDPTYEADTEEVLKTYGIGWENKECDVCGETVLDLSHHKATKHPEGLNKVLPPYKEDS